MKKDNFRPSKNVRDTRKDRPYGGPAVVGGRRESNEQYWTRAKSPPDNDLAKSAADHIQASKDRTALDGLLEAMDNLAPHQTRKVDPDEAIDKTHRKRQERMP